MITLNDIYFIIVLYKTDLEKCESFTSLSENIIDKKQKIDLLVYDNSPIPQVVKEKIGFWNTEYIYDKDNSGLSKAYNIGAKRAIDSGKKFIILLDQDTLFPENSLKIYLQSIADFKGINLFAPILRVENGKIMSPCKYVKRWGKFVDDMNPGIYKFKNFVPVNSGLCINLDAFSKSGGYNESVKLDGADFQFIEKFRRLYEEFCVVKIEAYQNFSMFDNDKTKVIRRYCMFLEDISNFESFQFWDRLYYFRVSMIRTYFVIKQTKNPIVLKYFLTKYLLKRK